MSKNKTTPISIKEKMQTSYLNYSLSVIIGRALPDVRDGLKPVHRRILYATKKLGLTHDKAHKKSARIVGEVLGKYHPHGDAAVYNAMVRMAQEFSQRYKLIDGHGNFGSIDGDNAAAMRYTEARLAKISKELLADIDDDTVDFNDNFDGSLEEPEVLPTKIPSLLVNGSSGIAVGMSTNIPPHNLNNVSDALIALLDNDTISIDKLINIIKGPDFPTGGQIIGKKGIKKAYKTGKGKVILRGKSKIEQKGNKRNKIIITEIPYQLSKAKLIEEIVDTVKKNKIKHVYDVRDETGREGLRVVIELKNKANPKIILNRLFKFTSLQKNFRINMLALVDRTPKVMNLKDILQHFIDFRKEIVTRRTEHRLKNAKDKAHTLIALKKATDQLDEVIAIIRNSRSTNKAKRKLQRKLELTKKQAKAILNMKLQRLVGLEIEKLEEDLKTTQAKIKDLESILANDSKLKDIIKTELLAIKDEYGDNRNTDIIEDINKAKLDKKDLIKDKKAVISLSFNKFIKRSEKVEQVRASKNDFITHILVGGSHDKLLIFSESDKAHILKLHNLPEHHSLSTGEPLKEFIKLPYNEKITGLFLLNKDTEQKNILLATKNGLVKKSKARDYETKISSLKAINLEESDRIIGLKATENDKNLLLATKKGYVIHFSEDEISLTGRNTKGSKGINLVKNDEVVSLATSNQNDYLIALTQNSRLIKKAISKLTIQKRNGRGINILETEKEEIKEAIAVSKEEEFALIDDEDNLIIENTDNIKAVNNTKLTDIRKIKKRS